MKLLQSLWLSISHGETIEQRVVKTLTCDDGTRLLEIAQREDGLYRYIEHRKLTARGETYWETGVFSGVFQSLDDAEREAQANLCWLRPRRSA
jgi:hypothetical protein